MRQSVIDGGEVLRDDGIALLAVGLLDHVLDALHGFIARKHAGNREKAGLQDGVDLGAESGVSSNPRGVNDEQMETLVDDLLLHGAREMIPGLFGPVRAVEQESGDGSGEPKYIDSIKEAELVAGDKACGGNLIG